MTLPSRTGARSIPLAAAPSPSARPPASRPSPRPCTPSRCRARPLCFAQVSRRFPPAARGETGNTDALSRLTQASRAVRATRGRALLRLATGALGQLDLRGRARLRRRSQFHLRQRRQPGGARLASQWQYRFLRSRLVSRVSSFQSPIWVYDRECSGEPQDIVTNRLSSRSSSPRNSSRPLSKFIPSLGAGTRQRRGQRLLRRKRLRGARKTTASGKPSRERDPAGPLSRHHPVSRARTRERERERERESARAAYSIAGLCGRVLLRQVGAETLRLPQRNGRTADRGRGSSDAARARQHDGDAVGAPAVSS